MVSLSVPKKVRCISAIIVLCICCCSRIDAATYDEQLLVSENPIEGGNFGISLAADGDYLMIGAPGETRDMIARAGRVYMYAKSGSSPWALHSTFNTGTDDFGKTVAMDGTVAMIANQAEVKVYERQASTAYVYTQTITNPQPNFFPARAIAIHGNWAVLGFPTDDTNDGAAYIYKRDIATGQWSLQETLQSPNSSPNHFGLSVAISGDYVAVGEPLPDAGYVHVFKRATDTSWNHVDTLAGATSWGFGQSLAMFGTEIAAGRVGGSGAVYLFDEGDPDDWVQTQELTADDPGFTLNQYFGGSVAYDGSRIVAGCDGISAVYVFEQDSGGWSQTDKLSSTDPASSSSDGLGTAVALNGDDIIAGAPSFGAAPLGFSGAVSIFSERSALPGDLNLDGSVSLADAIVGLLALSGDVSQTCSSSGDMDGDGIISMPDVLMIMESLP